MSKIRVVVVDDSALVRSILTEIINKQPDMECIGAASDPLVAREMIRNLNPDVITLDVEMPRMDGIDFLSRLMRLRPMPVVMVSTLTERGAEVTLKALELGAVDFVAKPKIGVADGIRQLASDITDKIRIAARAHVRRTPALVAAPGATPAAPALVANVGRLSTEKIIFIGASTGGTEATKDVLVSMRATARLCASHSTCPLDSPRATLSGWTDCARSASLRHETANGCCLVTPIWPRVASSSASSDRGRTTSPAWWMANR